MPDDVNNVINYGKNAQIYGKYAAQIPKIALAYNSIQNSVPILLSVKAAITSPANKGTKAAQPKKIEEWETIRDHFNDFIKNLSDGEPLKDFFNRQVKFIEKNHDPKYTHKAVKLDTNKIIDVKFFKNNNVFFYRSGAMVDSDGSPNNWKVDETGLDTFSNAQASFIDINDINIDKKNPDSILLTKFKELKKDETIKVDGVDLKLIEVKEKDNKLRKYVADNISFISQTAYNYSLISIDKLNSPLIEIKKEFDKKDEEINIATILKEIKNLFNALERKTSKEIGKLLELNERIEGYTKDMRTILGDLDKVTVESIQNIKKTDIDSFNKINPKDLRFRNISVFSQKKYVDAEKVPYIAYSDFENKKNNIPKDFKAMTGDLCLLFNRTDYRYTFAFIADTKTNQTGEISIAAATKLGIANTSPKNGGLKTDNIYYFIFPKSSRKKNYFDDDDALNDIDIQGDHIKNLLKSGSITQNR